MAALPFVLGALATFAGSGLSKAFWQNEKRDFEASERDRQRADLLDIFGNQDITTEQGRFGVAQGLLQNPEFVNVGANLLGQASQQQGANQRQTSQNEAALLRQQVAGAQAMDRQNQQQQFELQQRRDLLLEQQAIAGSNGRLTAKGPGGVALGVGRGYDWGIHEAIGIPGTQVHNDAQSEIDSLMTAHREMTDLITSFEKHGFESVGAESGAQSVRYGSILAAMGKLREMGVIDQKEYERLQDQLPNPGEANLFTSNSSALASYNQMLDQINVRLTAAQDKYRNWPKMDFSDPKSRVEAQAEIDAGRVDPATNLPQNFHLFLPVDEG